MNAETIGQTVSSFLSRFKSTKQSNKPAKFGTFGGVFTPLDTILNNTGFLNASGLMILYVISLAGILFVVYRFQLGTMLSVIGGILITALFMILGYMPLFVSILLITFYIIAIIQINKGGLFSE